MAQPLLTVQKKNEIYQKKRLPKKKTTPSYPYPKGVSPYLLLLLVPLLLTRTPYSYSYSYSYSYPKGVKGVDPYQKKRSGVKTVKG